MRKILVFDGGFGGEIVANYLESELGIADIVRVIDWSEVPYEEMAYAEICTRMEVRLEEYLGKVELIVLGGYACSQALEFLRSRYPMQKIVGMSIDYRKVKRGLRISRQMTVMAGQNFAATPTWEWLEQEFSGSDLHLADCIGWEKLIDIGEMSMDVLRTEVNSQFILPERNLPLEAIPAITQKRSFAPSRALCQYLRKTTEDMAAVFSPRFALAEGGMMDRVNSSERFLSGDQERVKAGLILLLNTHFWHIKPELEKLFGYSADIIDFREKLLHDVCLALELRGVDGRLGE